MATNTTNYNLVKPSENEYYDINVSNSNLDIIDTEIKRVNDRLDSVSTDAQSTSFDNSDNGMIATNVQDAIEENKEAIESNKTSILNNTNLANQALNKANEAFQRGDNVKTQLVDKLISEGLDVSTDNTFEELIGNIALGKKWASGIYSYSAYERINNKKIPVPILDFTPSIIIVKTDNLTYRSASLETYKTCSNLIISNNPVKIPTTNANGYATLSCSYSDGYITISTIAQDVCTDNAGSQEWYIYE